MRWLLPAVLLLCTRAHAHASPFVRVTGTGFSVGDKPFAFVGANLEALHGEVPRARYEATLDAARADGLTVVRVWALGEGAVDAPAWPRAHELFRAGPDGFLEAAYLQLDRVLAAARARDLRVILTLANHWGDYGGVPAYLAWAGLPSEGWGARDRFFSDERTRAFYRAHLERLLARTNQVTGVRYVDDPTVFAWELENESQVETPDGALARRSWIEEMAGAIRARDSHHLITPGVIGYSTRKERDQWLAVCRLAVVDYCDSHLYPQTTGEVAERAEVWAYIDDRVQLAHHVAHKPIVFGEFGFDTRPDRARWLERSRGDWFQDFLGRVFFDGGEGALVWIYQPWSGHARDFGIYTDRPDTDDVRGALRGWAGRVRETLPTAQNPLLSAARGEQLLYDPYRVVHHAAASRAVVSRDAIVVELDPAAFTTGRFERVGSWDGGALVHAYGAGDGFFEWRFRVPPRAPRHAQLVVRLSSEFPGTHAPPDGGSHLAIRLDDSEPIPLDVVPDDGLGQVYRVAIPRGLRSGEHTLRLEVPPGPHANGLCVYGAATGNGSSAPADAGPLRVVLSRRR